MRARPRERRFELDADRLHRVRAVAEELARREVERAGDRGGRLALDVAAAHELGAVAVLVAQRALDEHQHRVARDLAAEGALQLQRDLVALQHRGPPQVPQHAANRTVAPEPARVHRVQSLRTAVSPPGVFGSMRRRSERPARPPPSAGRNHAAFVPRSLVAGRTAGTGPHPSGPGEHDGHQTAPVFAVQRAGDRASFDHGWLQTHHSFSFADYVDPANVNWGALRVFNDDTVPPGQGFRTHPHRDMEIVTYVLRGQLEHRDSLGHHGVVPPGGIQYVSAGTGVRHSEFNHSATADVHFVQMWVVPRRRIEAPAYGQQTFSEDERRNRWLVVAGGEAGVGSVELRADATLRVAKLEDGEVTHAFDPARFGFLFVADGEVEANGEHLSAGDAVRIHGLRDLAVRGSGEIVLWDVPPAEAP